MTSVNQTTDNRTAYEKARAELSAPVPIGSDRDLQLRAQITARGWGDPKIDDMTDTMRGEMFAMFNKPEQATFKGDAPKWMDERMSDPSGSVAMNGNPVAVWSTENIFSVEGYAAAVVREDEYDVDSDTTNAGPVVLSLYGDDMAQLTDADTIRRIGFGILKAADQYEDILTETEHQPEEISDPVDGHRWPSKRVLVPTASAGVDIEVNNEEGTWKVYVDGLRGEMFTPSMAEFLCLEILRASHIAEHLNSEVTR